MPSLALIGAAALLLPLRAMAHGRDDEALTSASAWNFDPWVLALMALAGGAYLVGLRRLRSRAGPGRGLAPRQVLWFGLGWLTLAVALVSPLDSLGNHLFSAHMVQHELLMIVAAPLLVMGRPLGVWIWCLSPLQRHRLPALLARPTVARSWAAFTRPLTSWALHAMAIWLWHVPVLFDASLHSEWVHAAQHATFLLTALLFWWAVLGPARASERSASALAALFTTMLHTAMLGALLTVAATPWYGGYAETSLALGWDPLHDQQLGGLLMWVPGGAAYLIAALVVAAQLLDRRQAGNRNTNRRPGSSQGATRSTT